MAGLAAFGLCLAGSFHFDDYAVLTGNVWRTLATRPLTALTFWSENPLDQHVINLAFHLVATLLLYDFLVHQASRPVAFIAALIFAVHPIQAEAVNYVFARSSELDTLLCLAALCAWARGRHWWAVGWFAAALAAKEECVAFPIFLFLLWLAQGKRRAELKPLAAMFLLSLAAGTAVYIAVLRTPGVPAGPHAGITTAHYLLAQGPVILRYWRLLVIPWGFNVDPEIHVPPAWLGICAWLSIVSMATVAGRRFDTTKGGFWFIAGLILLLPSSSIFAAEDLAADRRMYLPMIAFSACAGLLLERARPAAVGLIAVVLIALSVQRTLVWRTEQSLWSDAVQQSPDKVRPKVQLARASSDPARSLELLQQAEALAPNDARIPAEQGRVYLSAGDAARALSAFGRALALDPSNADALNNRGAALLALGQKDAARQDFERALSIDPCQVNARANLSRMGIETPAPPQCR